MLQLFESGKQRHVPEPIIIESCEDTIRELATLSIASLFTHNIFLKLRSVVSIL